ncbi:glucan-binding protein, partial [Bacillus toyonensis]
GKLHYGLLEYNGKTYFLNPDNGQMFTKAWIGEYHTGNYFLEDGSMAIGWTSIDNKWYYFNDKGLSYNDWLSYNGSWYFFLGGKMQTGWVQDNG